MTPRKDPGGHPPPLAQDAGKVYLVHTLFSYLAPQRFTTPENMTLVNLEVVVRLASTFDKAC